MTKELRPSDIERFDDASRHVMDLAREEGRFFQQDYVGTEHILGGLLRARDPLVDKVLRSFEIGSDSFRMVVHTVIASGLLPKPPPRDLLTRRARRVLDLARREAGDGPVRPPHVLLALVAEGSGGVASTVLTAMNVDLLELRDKLLSDLASEQPDT